VKTYSSGMLLPQETDSDLRNVQNNVKQQTEIRNTLNLQTVSPNPTDGQVKINYLGTMDAAVTVELYDLSGRRLLHRKFTANQPIRIDSSSANPPVGQYLLKITRAEMRYFNRWYW